MTTPPDPSLPAPGATRTGSADLPATTGDARLRGVLTVRRQCERENAVRAISSQYRGWWPHLSLSRDSAFKWALIAATLLANVSLVAALGLSVAFRSLLWPFGFAAVLCAFGVFYRRRGVANFVLCTNALLHLVLFSSSFAILMYCGASFGRPLIDDYLAAIDHRLGWHVPTLMAWVQNHSAIERTLQIAYDTILLQTGLLVAVLGFRGDRIPLELFVQRLMLGACVTFAVFIVLPAAGPFEAYGFEGNLHQQRYMQHLTALRGGEMSIISLSQSEGLITFPSFHTTWAMLLALALAHRRMLLIGGVLWNGAVVLATMTTGWHYFSDVLAGGVVCFMVVGASHCISRWSHPNVRDRSAPNAHGLQDRRAPAVEDRA